MFQEYHLKNNLLDLTVIPQFGCLWSGLRLNVDGQWLDLLWPLPGQELLAKRSGAGYGSYLLAPWSNRIRGGVFEYEHQKYRLRRNSPDGTALHGDVRTRPWRVVESSKTRLEAELDSAEFKDFNYPFPFHYRHNVELTDQGLLAGIWIKNLSPNRAPAGLGFHPFFVRRLTASDPDVELAVPAEKVYPALRCLPVGPAVPAVGKLDLKPRALLGKRGLDHCFTGLKPGPVKILYPGTRVEVVMRMDSLFNHVVVYAPDSWWGLGPSKPFFCVEPVTHVNDGFNLFAKGWEGTGVKELEPGESWGGSFELTIARTS